MNRKRLLEMIDACRPGSDDHLHGELAELGEEIVRDAAARELFDQVQALDTRLVDLFQASASDIEVPAGLQQKIQAALAANAATQAETGDLSRLAAAVEAAIEEAPESPATKSVRKSPAELPSRRRVWGVMLGSLAAMAAIAMVAVVLQDEPPQLLTAQQVADRAVSWEANLTDEGWHSDVAQKLQAVPVPDLRHSPFRWQNWQDPWQGEGVVYDLSPSTAPESTFLYATKAVENVSGLPVGPPSKAQSSTGNLSVAVWQRNSTLYVLVIHGPQDRYRRLIDQPDFAQHTPARLPVGCYCWFAQ